MTSERKNWITIKNSVFLLLGVGLVYLFVSSAVDNRFREIEINTRTQIAEQEAILAAIAETTARNGADAVTESIVRDCNMNERSRFDTLLGSLDSGLPRAELIELERLFGRCGTFFSERKSVMVARLSREIEIFEDYVAHLSIITDSDLTAEYSVEQWKALAAEEQKQSELFGELVRLQDQIISSLLAGNTIDSAEMEDILLQVREVQETLIVANAQAGNIRSELVPL